MNSTQAAPKRIVLRFHEDYGWDHGIQEKFFETMKIDPADDYFLHLVPPDDDSNKMHFVIDLYCKSFPTVNLDQVPHEVYRVKKKDDL
jgi:hypothetical protein